MYIVWKDPNMRLHGKQHKGDCFYFRWHYGKQRMVHVVAEYVDKPTEKQVSAREAFTALRREVSRQLRNAELRAAWMRRFEADNEGYKFLHTYVYAMMKQGVSVTQSTTCRDGIHAVSQSTTKTIHETACMPSLHVSQPPIIIVHNGTIVPIFLPWEIPKTERLRI